jgi:hypothetical protein
VDADDKYFNYSVMAKLGCAIPKTVLLPQKGYPSDIDLTAESLRNLEYPIDWDALLDYVGRPPSSSRIPAAAGSMCTRSTIGANCSRRTTAPRRTA